MNILPDDIDKILVKICWKYIVDFLSFQLYPINLFKGPEKTTLPPEPEKKTRFI